MSRFRIVVADQAEAIFYDTASLERRPTEVGRISDPLAHLHDRDFSSDRPGRSYESMGGQRHAIARENDPRRQEAVQFARRISKRLDEARRKDEFEELIVVAGPPFLGMMRAAAVEAHPGPGGPRGAARTSCTARSSRCAATCRPRPRSCARRNCGVRPGAGGRTVTELAQAGATLVHIAGGRILAPAAT